jgi:hypothetical protein
LNKSSCMFSAQGAWTQPLQKWIWALAYLRELCPLTLTKVGVRVILAALLLCLPATVAIAKVDDDFLDRSDDTKKIVHT